MLVSEWPLFLKVSVFLLPSHEDKVSVWKPHLLSTMKLQGNKSSSLFI